MPKEGFERDSPDCHLVTHAWLVRRSRRVTKKRRVAKSCLPDVFRSMLASDFLERGCGLGNHAVRLIDQNGRQENGGQNVRNECDQRYDDSDLCELQNIFDVGVARHCSDHFLGGGKRDESDNEADDIEQSTANHNTDASAYNAANCKVAAG